MKHYALIMPYRIKLMSHLLNAKLWFLFLSIDVTFFWPFVNKYLTSDVGYIKWLGVAMAIDLITGITKVVVTEGYKAVTSRGIRDTVTKAITYGAFIIITHLVTHFEVKGEVVNNGWSWIDAKVCEFLMIIEGKSVYENIIKISPSLDFIKYLVDKITMLLKKKE